MIKRTWHIPKVWFSEWIIATDNILFDQLEPFKGKTEEEKEEDRILKERFPRPIDRNRDFIDMAREQEEIDYGIEKLTFEKCRNHELLDWEDGKKEVENIMNAIEKCKLYSSLQVIKIKNWGVRKEIVQDIIEDHGLEHIQLAGFDKEESIRMDKIGSKRTSGNSTNSSVPNKPTPKGKQNGSLSDIAEDKIEQSLSKDYETPEGDDSDSDGESNEEEDESNNEESDEDESALDASSIEVSVDSYQDKDEEESENNGY